MLIKIKKIENGKIPEYKTEGSAGADCYARIENQQTIEPGKVITIPLGFAVELPEGYEMQIRGRSGLARKNSIEVFNAPGTIDSDYRGEVGAILYNASTEPFIINPGDRIAQAIVAPVIRAEWHLTENLSETERGSGGFGSTGVKSEMSYNHPIEKFYEPFNNMSDLESILGKEVIIDNTFRATFERIVHSGLSLHLYFKIVGAIKEIDLKDVINHEFEMNTIMAFERVKIDNHRFGKEMEFKERN